LKIIKIAVITGIVLMSNNCLFANEKNAPAEKGWRFGEFNDLNKSVSKAKTEKEMLSNIMKIELEQLKVQKKMLKILQKRFDPQPEIITVNGKKCVANSSAECYKWIPEPEAQRYPVIANFFSNPNKESAKKYLQWYSKHINNAEKAGISIYLAKMQYGKKATDFNIKNNGMLGANGEFREAQEKHYKELLLKNKNKLHVNIYIGRGLEIDMFGMEGISYLIDELPELTYNVIYYNNDVKNKLHKISKKYKYLNNIFYHTNEIVSSKMFKINKIYTTPSIAIVLEKDNSSQIIATGKVSPTNFIQKTVKYLWYKKIIKENDYMSGSNLWDSSKYLERKQEYDYTKKFDINKYKYKNTNLDK